ncbi:hypothetical protein KVP40.0166 [Vibrio phage KVP40]|uniref:Uncharacterized protein n=1 Tax=Vibrio phage KVP40 (isolate Vibrio parahaemolyticus/Japan/Matsuzaki/1991) TaxID=75320 RepID=Q6WHY8_BPKVM|nr:hypothetical protein KVP40.0166 [Vibrio phage KVP40]AAQ64235.1 hypothetical protein KVP40.0166 [Vibrio phage KVP40]UNA02071.1 hypothetical protein [Vibrio phage PC-Liy1]URQ03370.1 hypothetical protein PVA8_384 [Vibrio phage PVA8]WBM59103.1 hypothetical protein vBValMPVA8_381 [Vibrio phage vB_ValM_PVA8]
MNVANVMSQHASIQYALIEYLNAQYDGEGHIEYAEYFEDIQAWEVQYYDGEFLHELTVTAQAIETWMNK